MVMVAQCGVQQCRLNLTSSSTNRYRRALSDRDLCRALGGTLCADGVGWRRRTLLHPLPLSESFTHGALSPLGPLVGSASFVMF